MDLAIQGRRALVCAGSPRLGRARAEALAAEGGLVTVTPGNAEVLKRTADEIAAISGVPILFAAGDISTEDDLRQPSKPRGRSRELVLSMHPVGNTAWGIAVAPVRGGQILASAKTRPLPVSTIARQLECAAI